MSQRARTPGRWWYVTPLVPGVLVLLGMGSLPRPNRTAPHRQVVEIRGMAFQPAVLEVARGDTIVWVNRDIVPHTATAAGEPGWTTGTLGQSDTGRHVPRHSDTIPYFCELHPVMKGKLIIR